jgi:hypothetical protein
MLEPENGNGGQDSNDSPDDSSATGKGIDIDSVGITEIVQSGQNALFQQNIDPSNDVDFFRVDLLGGDRVIFDIDDGNDAADLDFLDTILTVFNQNGEVVTFNDDSPVDPGSTSSLDSFIDFTAPANGSYLVAVSSFANFFDTVTGDWTNNGSSTGDYVLSIRHVDDFFGV